MDEQKQTILQRFRDAMKEDDMCDKKEPMKDCGEDMETDLMKDELSEKSKQEEILEELKQQIEELTQVSNIQIKKLSLPEQKSTLEVAKLFLEATLLGLEINRLIPGTQVGISGDLMPLGVTVNRLAVAS